MDITNSISILTPDPLAAAKARSASADRPGGLELPGIGGLAQKQRSFTEVLSQTTGGNGPAVTNEARARETAQDFLAMAFVQPVLKQLRETNNTPPPFGPGKGEQHFRALMDAQIARNIVKKTGWPLADRLARRMLERGEQLAGGPAAAQGRTEQEQSGEGTPNP